MQSLTFKDFDTEEAEESSSGRESENGGCRLCSAWECYVACVTGLDPEFCECSPGSCDGGCSGGERLLRNVYEREIGDIQGELETNVRGTSGPNCAYVQLLEAPE